MVILCEICNKHEATVTCKRCGRRVCRDHQANGLCIICLQTTCMVCGKNLAIGYCSLCGRMGCDECLIQVDNVRRVCKECVRKYGGIEKVRTLLRETYKIIKLAIPPTT